MVAALGQMPNAPLIYVLAQIVFTRIPKMNLLWEDFHQSVFELYPEGFPENIKEFHFLNADNPSVSEITRWQLINREKTEGIILGSNVLTFHATNYKTSSDFFEKLGVIMENFAKIAPKSISVSRIGLRYIDLLIPINGLHVDEQVSGKLGGIDLEEAGCTFQKLEEVSTFKTSVKGELVIRHRQSKTKDILPGDLFPNNLKPAPLLQKEVQPNSTVALLDYDHYIQKLDSDFEAATVMDTLVEMHKTSSKAFRLTTTDSAKKLWSEN